MFFSILWAYTVDIPGFDPEEHLFGYSPPTGRVIRPLFLFSGKNEIQPRKSFICDGITLPGCGIDFGHENE